MQRTKPLVIAVTLAAIGLVGNADARDRDGGDRGHRDGTRTEQNVQRRQRRNPSTERAEHRTGKRDDRQARHDRSRSGNHDSARSDRFAARFDARQDRQRKKIRKGLHRGDLTRSEGRHLRSQQRRIDHMADRFGRDGHFSRGERKRLAKAQKRARRTIRSARHNDSYRYRSHRSYGRDNYDRHGFWRCLDY